MATAEKTSSRLAAAGRGLEHKQEEKMKIEKDEVLKRIDKDLLDKTVREIHKQLIGKGFSFYMAEAILDHAKETLKRATVS